MQFGEYSLRRNVFWGAFSNLSLAVIHFAFTGLCVLVVSADAFGLVAFSTTVLLTAVSLNQFTNPVLVRALGRLRVEQAETVSESCHLLRTLEATSLIVSAALGVLIVICAPLLAHYGLKSNTIPEAELVYDIRLIGLAIACQWPTFFYRAGFVGLGRQDAFSFVSVPFTIIQSAGGLAILWVEPQVSLLFLWQAGTSFVYCFALRALLWHCMPATTERAKASLETLSSIWRFGAGSLLIGFTATLLTQTDKLAVSTFSTLNVFSAYVLASMISVQIGTVVASPISVALLPRFAKLVAGHDARALADEYFKWAQLLLILVLPILGVGFFFSKPLLTLWLGPNSELLPLTQDFVPLLTLGTLFNVMAIPPYILQLSAGWTSLMVRFNLIAWIVMTAVLAIGVPRYGALVAAGCWLALNISYYLVMAPIVHAKLLSSERWARWLIATLGPSALTAAIFYASATFVSVGAAPLAMTAQAALTALCAWAALLFLTPAGRDEVARLKSWA